MTEDQRITEAELHAYVDKQLSATRRAEVEAWLNHHPAEARKLADYQALTTGLHALYDPVLTETLPKSLRPRESRTRARGRSVMLAACWTLVGMISGWIVHEQYAAMPEVALLTHLVQPAAFAHTVYSTDTHQPVEVVAQEQPRLIHWLSERLRTEIRVPSLNAFGYSLVGGRLLPSTNRMAAQLMYQNAAGLRVTLYVRRVLGVVPLRSGDKVRMSQIQSLHTYYWTDGELGYAVSGEINRDALLQLAESTRRQLTL